MKIGTFVTSHWAYPVETIQIILDSLEEITAGNNRVWRRAEFVTWVSVQIDSHITGISEGQIVTVFTSLALLTDTSLEVGTQGLLLVDYRSDRLDANSQCLSAIID